MSECMTLKRERAMERVRAMWDAAAADGYQHTMDVFADEFLAVQSEAEARGREIERLQSRVAELEENAVDAHNQIDQIRKQAARECVEITRRWRYSYDTEGSEREIRERFGLGVK